MRNQNLKTVSSADRIKRAYESILEIYHQESDCIGDLLSSVDCAEYALTMEEAFILNMKLRHDIDGDDFYRKIDSGDMEKYDEETEWFNNID